MDNLKKISTQLGGKIKSQNNLNVNFKELSTRELIIKDYKGYKLNIEEYGNLYQMNIEVESDFVFSINNPERIFKIDCPANLSNFPYKIYILEDQYSPFFNKDFDKFWDTFSNKVKEIKLLGDESVFFDGYRMSLIFESTRDIITILDEMVKLIEDNSSFFKRKSEVKLYKKNIPNELKALFPLLKKWSISDDLEREQLVEQIGERKRKKLINSVDPYMNEINKFLDSFNNQHLSNEAISIGNLAELISELKIDR